jgi:hypothetical protein
MSLYPPSHPPFRPWGWPIDTQMEATIAEVAQMPLGEALGHAAVRMLMLPIFLESIRAGFFRAEQLAHQEPVPRDEPALHLERLPTLAPALIESLEATRRCLEEWLESRTCRKLASENSV